VRIWSDTFLVDQSFSDFGDADLTVLVKTPNEKMTIFIEAKVKTCQKKKWILDDEYQRFLRGIEGKNLSSSNLFVQMYHKYLLFEHLKKYGLARLKNGVEAQDFFKKKVKKIGNNEVVLRAAKLIGEHADRAYYVMLVPTISAEARSVGRTLIRKDNIFKKINTLGYVTWHKILNFALKNDLSIVLENFSWNKCQIFNELPLTEREVSEIEAQYKDILDEKDPEEKRLKIYRLLVNLFRNRKTRIDEYDSMFVNETYDKLLVSDFALDEILEILTGLSQGYIYWGDMSPSDETILLEAFKTVKPFLVELIAKHNKTKAYLA